jgi:acetylornithine/LysW-gamma-L-lysine aminotransferase
MTTDQISGEIPSGAHGTTFGANPLAARAVVTTLRALRQRNLYDRAVKIGEALISGLNNLNSPQIRQVRGRGLMIGVELKGRVTPALRTLQERGVLVLPAGATTFRLLPPMIWDQAQVDEFLGVAGEVLS